MYRAAAEHWVIGDWTIRGRQSISTTLKSDQRQQPSDQSTSDHVTSTRRAPKKDTSGYAGLPPTAHTQRKQLARRNVKRIFLRSQYCRPRFRVHYFAAPQVDNKPDLRWHRFGTQWTRHATGTRGRRGDEKRKVQHREKRNGETTKKHTKT